MITNEENISVEKINVKYSEMDHNLALKPYSLLNFLQDIASENAEKLGFGYSFVSKNNLAWFLIKYRMEFNDYPVNVLNLTLKTQPRGYNKLFAYREFELYENEKILGRVFSVWTLVDINSRQPVLIGNTIQNKDMSLLVKKEDDLSFGKLRAVENPSITKQFEVRYNDLDVNGHANNGNYIIWAFEPLTLDFKTKHKIKTLDMMFKKEAKYGEKITVEIAYKDELTTIHTIKNSENEDLCFVECSWI